MTSQTKTNLNYQLGWLFSIDEEIFSEDQKKVRVTAQPSWNAFEVRRGCIHFDPIKKQEVFEGFEVDFELREAVTCLGVPPSLLEDGAIWFQRWLDLMAVENGSKS